MTTGWTRQIAPHALTWAQGGTIYSPTYARGTTIAPRDWTQYKNGQPIYHPPVNTVAPVVTGTAQEYLTLSCTTGTWSSQSTITYSYQWRRDSSNIVGATSSTYVLTTSDYQKYIDCVVTATNSGGGTPAASNSVGPVVEGAPINTVAPAVSGTAMVGQVVSTTNGTWTSETTLSYAYLWIRNTGGAGTPIVGATSSSYTVQVADIGYALHCQVSATNTTATTAAQSNNTSTVVDSAPVNTVAPVASGYVYVNTTLSCTTGTWTSNTTLSYTYQWKRNGSNISSATSSTYVVVAADEGQSITCSVTASNTGNSASATSNALTNWVPSSLSPVGWWDFSDLSTVTKDGSNKITAVTNKSGAASTVTASSTREPVYTTSAINSRAAALFDGTNDRLDGTLGANQSACTVWMVVLPSRLRRFDAFFDSAAAVTGDLTCEQGASSTIEFYVYNVGAAAASSGTISTSTQKAISYLYDGTTLTTYVNNAGSGSAASASRTLKSAFAIGGDRGTGGFFFTQGYIAEVVVMSTAASSTDRTNLQTYATNKWGV